MNIISQVRSDHTDFTTWKHWLLRGGIGVLLLLLTSCQEFYTLVYSSLREQDPPPWRGESVTVDLTGMLHPLVYEIEFAARNEPYLGFWSLEPTHPDSDYGLATSGQLQPGSSGHYVVIDFQGNMVADAVTANGALSERYVDMFPTIAAKQRYAKLLQDAEFWAFSPDGVYGMKSDTCYEDTLGTRIMSCNNYNRESINFEFWDLSKRVLLWETVVQGYAILLAHSIVWQGQAAVLIALPYRADILSQATGETLGSFEYAPLREKDEVGPGHFRGLHFAYHADERWLACGAFETGRVRFYGIDPPYPLLRELNQSPRSGAWHVDGVALNGNARYLTVATSFTGMNRRHPRFPTEVYDVTTWKRVWYENRKDVWNVAVSPDGGKIAFLRMESPGYKGGIRLELGDFYPEETP